ncbi:MAG: sigma-70 family RNA polymerase sigma factor [Pseudolabrys sp.]
MSEASAAGGDRQDFARLVAATRPKLHRYCARMTGSVIDGEDVLQDALIKALEASPPAEPLANPEGWLFRIAHNAALDFLRRRARQAQTHSDEDPDVMVDPFSPLQDREIAATSLRTFMRLPVAQRSSVILMDVLGYSLDEISAVMDATIPAVKAALHRGRARLRVLAREEDDVAPPSLSGAERARLAAYIDRFNARDFDALRALLAEDVRLDLVSRQPLVGLEVARYFTNYSRADDWQLVAGMVDGRAAALVRNPRDPGAPPSYFILLEWDGDSLRGIRDFRHARYAIDSAAVTVL